MPGDAPIRTLKIHPAIGIARIGNSPRGYFVGPELLGEAAMPEGGYKDARGRVKRQAARFRIFGYDSKGAVVQEITDADAKIRWTVHLANKKAAWRRFEGLRHYAAWRNPRVKDRKSLIIDPGPRSLEGPRKSARFDSGRFLGTPVPLGEIRTDRHGRLLVLGGFGQSSSPTNAPLDEQEFANNDGWHDDVSDGPVTAQVVLSGRKTKKAASPAWIICAPPKFAPPLNHAITLYDAMLQRAVKSFGLKVPSKPSFTRDIYPILQRALLMRWVNGMVARGGMGEHRHGADEDHEPEEPEEEEHGEHHGQEESDEDQRREAAGPSHGTFANVIPPPGTAAQRSAIFRRLRNPSLAPDEETEADMPMLWSEYYDRAGYSQPLTRVQYAALKKWKEGKFINDWNGPPDATSQITPETLDRAALEQCVGAPLFPGIEAGWLLRDVYAYTEPFRLDAAQLTAGDVTKQLAVPWQSDFYDCAQEDEYAWWPAHRPDDVYPEYGRPQVPWLRNIVHSKRDLVHKWGRLGFVVKKARGYLETGRRP